MLIQHSVDGTFNYISTRNSFDVLVDRRSRTQAFFTTTFFTCEEVRMMLVFPLFTSI